MAFVALKLSQVIAKNALKEMVAAGACARRLGFEDLSKEIV